MMRALVLGGGGVTGVAWEWGVIAGLADAGVELGAADLIIGTSAGSVVGAQLAAGADVHERLAAQLDGAGAEPVASLPSLVMARWGWAVVRSRTAERAGRRIGRVALSAKTGSFESRRAQLATRMPAGGWPQRRLLITAVDAESGQRVAFDRDAGVDLLDAVCASCAVPGVWPAVAIDGHRYIDGGVHSAANADLAADVDRIVIIAPLGRGFGPVASVAAQAADLRGHAQVAVVQPDKPALKAIGRNLLDPGRRAPAACAGKDQAQALAEHIDRIWSGSSH
jgi:NTE family protein